MPDSTAPPPTADAVVVGGGVMGASIAYHLARAGAGRVVLLEKRFLAAGSTGKSGAICRQHYSNVLTATMAKRSLEIFTNFDDAIGGDCGFVRTGFIAVVSPEDRDSLAVNLELQRSVGIDTRSVSPDELCAIDPQAAATDVGAACYEPDAGYADPVLTTASFAEAAQRHGAIICEGTPLVGIVREGDRIGGVQTPKGTISTRVVVNAAGPWARRVMGMVGEDIPCDVARVQAAIYRRPPDFGAPHAVYGDFIHQIYFKPHGGAQTQVGSIDPAEAKNRADPDDYDEGIESDFITACRERMAKRLPIMAQSIAGGGWSGLYTLTPDWHPILDHVTQVVGLYVATGFSGHGFKLSPVVGECMAELVTEGQATTLDISPLRASRFAQGELVRGRYEYSIIG